MKMKLKLIKLSETHYIVVSDEEIKEGDFIFDDFCKINNIQKVRRCDFDSSHYRYGNWEKITNSTKPLEFQETGALNNKEFYYFKIKPLSLSEAQEIEFGCYVEKMAIESAIEIWSDETTLENEQRELNGHIIGFKEGFNAHKELTKDNVFTMEDMQNSLLELIKEVSCEDGSLISKTPVEAYRWIEEHMKSLLPKTEWDVEFDANGKLKLRGNE